MGSALSCQLLMGEGPTQCDTRWIHGALGPLGASGASCREALLSQDLPGMKVLSGRTCLRNNQFPVEVSGMCCVFDPQVLPW